MAEEENFECEECGKSFDSQRGLSIHKTQIHPEEDNTQESEDHTEEVTQKSSVENNSTTISITTRQALGVVLAFGLAIGFSAGLLVSGFTGAQPTISPTENNENTQPTDNSQIGSGTPTKVMKEIAGTMGINGDQIASCIESSDGSEIAQDRSEIDEVTGGIGTPTFFIGNNQVGYAEVTGAQPYSQMKSTIDQKIDEANSGDTNVGSEEYTLESISFEAEPTLGKESAPINIIEYSDYGCPWCAEWHGVNAIDQRPIDEEDSFNKVRSNYVETGDVQFVLKDYPVAQLHPQAETAHKAANCVLENSPEDFWEFSQNIFEERDKW